MLNPEQYKNDQINYIFRKTAKYQQKFNLKMNPNTVGHNDETDAFRHAFMQAYLTFKVGKGIAEWIGDDHEKDENKGLRMSDDQWKKEKNMDLWNNAIGREIAEEVKGEIKGIENAFTKEQTEDMIAVKIRDRIRNGDMITDLNDKRDFNKSYHGGHVYTREEIKNMSNKEFQENERHIMKQMQEKGIPTQAEAQSKWGLKTGSKFGGSSSYSNGRWVTINGNHVFIEN